MDGFWKNEQILPGFLCKLRMADITLLLKSALSVTTMRPTVSAFKCFLVGIAIRRVRRQEEQP